MDGLAKVSCRIQPVVTSPLRECMPRSSRYTLTTKLNCFLDYRNV